MPTALNQAFEVLLDFQNDTNDCATVQLQRDYGRNRAIVLLHPGESVTLVLDAGSVYKYAVKMHSKVANVTFVFGVVYLHFYLPDKGVLERGLGAT